MPAAADLGGVNVALAQELGRDTRMRSMLAPLEVLRPGDADRLGLDLVAATACQQKLLAVREALAIKIREVFTSPPRETADAELSLYAGFPGDADKQRFARVRAFLRSRSGETKRGSIVH